MSDNEDIKIGITALEMLAVLLTVMFIGLKLTGVIGWGWFYVLSPALLCLCLPTFLIGSLLLVLILIHIVTEWFG